MFLLYFWCIFTFEISGSWVHDLRKLCKLSNLQVHLVTKLEWGKKYTYTELKKKNIYNLTIKCRPCTSLKSPMTIMNYRSPNKSNNLRVYKEHLNASQQRPLCISWPVIGRERLSVTAGRRRQSGVEVKSKGAAEHSNTIIGPNTQAGEQFICVLCSL